MFCRRTVVFSVPFLFLKEELVELLLKIDKKFAQFGVAVERIFELCGKLVVIFLEMFQDRIQLFSFFTLIRELLFKSQKFVAFGV